MSAPVHPDIAALIAAGRAAGSPPFESMTPAEARTAYAGRRAVLQDPPEAVASIRDATSPGPAGPIPLRLYRPAGSANGAALPGLLFLHGGGWVLGTLDSHEALCCGLANASGGCVISVDYRLAPEHRFPAAVEDAAAAFGTVAREAGSFGLDPARLAVGGDSAGGNLAAVLALMGRDGTAPRAVAQLLLYPVTDLAMAGPGYARVTDGMTITPATMRYFVDHYSPDPADRTDWRASPLRAPSLAGAPRALVVTCGHDPLAEEGRAYAERLEREDVPVTALHLSDNAHGFLTMSRMVPGGAGVVALAGAFLRDAWRIAASG